MSVPRIDARGCGYWPTAKGSPSGPDFARTNRKGSGGDDLATRVARGQSTPQTWGTPTTRDHKATGTMENVPENALLGRQVLNRQWQTPSKACADGGQTSRGGDRKGELLLAGQAQETERQRWQTPCTVNRKSERAMAPSVNNGRRTGGGQSSPPGLEQQAEMVEGIPPTPGSLNPTWVEWLMGWPRGWTDCEHSGTDRCLSRWQQRGRYWLDLLGY